MNFVIGSEVDSTGVVTVDGSSSSLTISGSTAVLFVGVLGTGTFD